MDPQGLKRPGKPRGEMLRLAPDFAAGVTILVELATLAMIVKVRGSFGLTWSGVSREDRGAPWNEPRSPHRWTTLYC